MKNAEKDIGKCLASMKDSVDELVVVDTGSTDRSMEIARQYTRRLYTFRWRDDFSAAKNFALDMATGEYVVFLDADEYFTEETMKNIRSVLMAYHRDLNWQVLHVRMVNIDEEQPEIRQDYVVVRRIFRHKPELRYVNRVHEYMSDLTGRTIRGRIVPQESLQLYHTGYSKNRMKEKHHRNLELLEKERNRKNCMSHLYYYLAPMYEEDGRHREAAEYAERSIRDEGLSPFDGFMPYRIWFKAVKALGDEAEMRRVLEQGIRDFPNMPDFYAEYGVIHYNAERNDEALPYFLQTEEKYNNFEKLNPREFNRFLHKMPIIYSCIADIYAEAGDEAKAAAYREKERKAKQPPKAKKQE